MTTERRLVKQSNRLSIVGALVLIMLVILPTATVEAQNDPRVFRIELRLETADIDHADTGDDIFVQLNDSHITWLDHARNDFEKGDVYLYDVLLDEISRLSDIRYFRIGIRGDDGWCVKRIELYVNRGLLFRNTWPGSQCRWIDNDDGHSPEYLVQRDQFDLSLPGNGPALNTLAPDNLQRIVETAIGHSIAGRSYYWGTVGFVTLTDVSGDTLRVDATLRERRVGFNGTVDMRFDLVISCQDDVRVALGGSRITKHWSLSIGGGVLTATDPLMEATRRYLRQILNRRVQDCSGSNTIVVTRGPEIRIRQ